MTLERVANAAALRGWKEQSKPQLLFDKGGGEPRKNIGYNFTKN